MIVALHLFDILSYGGTAILLVADQLIQFAGIVILLEWDKALMYLNLDHVLL